MRAELLHVGHEMARRIVVEFAERHRAAAAALVDYVSEAQGNAGPQALAAAVRADVRKRFAVDLEQEPVVLP